MARPNCQKRLTSDTVAHGRVSEFFAVSRHKESLAEKTGVLPTGYFRAVNLELCEHRIGCGGRRFGCGFAPIVVIHRSSRCDGTKMGQSDFLQERVFMNVIRTEIPEVLILEPKVFGDSRGYFMESFNAKTFAAATGVTLPFVQDNHSRSARGVLRGLHYQIQQPQGKLVRVATGKVFDVAVDIRRRSKTFGKAVGVELSEENHRSVWVPPGFAHGFLVMSERADFLYKTTDYYAPAFERAIRWDDPALGIQWPLEAVGGVPTLSEKDRKAGGLGEAEMFENW